MSLRPLAIVKDLKSLKVFLEQSKRLSPLLFAAVRSLNSRAQLQSALKKHSRILLHGFRVAKLSTTDCEIVIPKTWFTEGPQHEIHESTFASAAHFGADVFWQFINPEPRIWFARLQSSHVEIIGTMPATLQKVKLRMHFPFQERENLFFALREGQGAEMSLHFDGMSVEDKLVCQIELKYKVFSQPQMSIEG